MRIFYLSILFLSLQVSANSRLLSYEPFKSFAADELRQEWKENGISNFIVPVSHGVDVYEIIYQTEWIDGSMIKASGYLYVPQGLEEDAPMACYHHGTRLKRQKNFRLGGEEAICIAFATDGYVVVQPDYIGLGKGDKVHLYQHADSEADASIDMMRAVRELQDELGFVLDGKLFLTGYSQGGHATMALHRKLQSELADEFSVTASSPMSGAYDMSGVQSEVMFRTYETPAYLAYLLYSYQDAYQLYDDVDQIWKAPYDSIIPMFFDRNESLSKLNKYLPDTPSAMLKDEIVSEYLYNPDSPFTLALQENDTYDWAPASPMLLCYCEADEQVTYKNALVAYETMRENGSEVVELRHSGKKFRHNTCALYSSIYTKWWFDSIRDGSEKGRKGPFFKRFVLSLSKIKM